MINVTSTVPLRSPHTNLGASPSASGVTTLVAAVPSCVIRVLSVVIVATLANAVKFQSAANDISATFPLAANGGFVMPFNEHGWFQTNPGEALNVNLGTATSTGVQIQYIVLLPSAV